MRLSGTRGQPGFFLRDDGMSFGHKKTLLPFGIRVGQSELLTLARAAPALPTEAGDPKVALILSQPLIAPAASSDSALLTGEGHWAFQPIRAPEVPRIKNKTWASSPVDSFILAKLEQRGLQPSARTDKRTLCRRAFFDLI